MRHAIGASLVLMATAVGPLHAQAPSGFGRLEPGQTVRVKTVGGSRFVTRLGGTAGDSPFALFGAAETAFQAERVDSLWVRGRATVTGLIVGGAVMTPVSFAFWAWVCEIVSEGTGCDAWGTVAGLSLAGGAAGALLGAGIGTLVPKWRLRYARERDALVGPLVTTDGRIGLTIRF